MEQGKLDLERVLEHLDCSMLSYDEWLAVGMALKQEGYGFHVFDNWCRTDAQRYHAKDVALKWESFKGGAVDGGTIVYLAKQQGYQVSASDFADGGNNYTYYENNAQNANFGASEVSYMNSNEALSPIEEASPQIPILNLKVTPHGFKMPSAEPSINECMKYLSAMYDDTDIINIVEAKLNNQGKYAPIDKGLFMSIAEFKYALVGSEASLSMVSSLFDASKVGGAYICINPLKGDSRTDANVSDFRYGLIECDNMPLEVQYGYINALNLPIKALAYSGVKSIHAVVKIDAKDKTEYDERVRFLQNVCIMNGFSIDKANKNASRLSRLVGVRRGDTRQALLDVEIGASSYQAWLEWIEEQLRKDAVEAYNNTMRVAEMKQGFYAYVSSEKSERIKTNIKPFDDFVGGGLPRGLVFIGAQPSIGKTTMSLQIGDAFARGGQKVLILSLEMPKNELIAKSISRMTMDYGMNNNLESVKRTTQEVIDYEFRSKLQMTEFKALTECETAYFKEIGVNTFIYEGQNDDINSIKKVIQDFIDVYKEEKPIVIIDYMQVIMPPKGLKKSERQVSDEVILELKQMSRTHNMCIIMISSLNRKSYNMPITLDSFKETGMIEYSADVLLGLDFRNRRIAEAQNKSKPTETEVTLHFEKEKSQLKRELVLKLLKNRNGEAPKSLYVDFYAKFNYFNFYLNQEKIEQALKNE